MLCIRINHSTDAIMSEHKLDIYNAANAYSKQISLSRLVQKKRSVKPSANTDDKASSEIGNPPSVEDEHDVNDDET